MNGKRTLISDVNTISRLIYIDIHGQCDRNPHWVCPTDWRSEHCCLSIIVFIAVQESFWTLISANGGKVPGYCSITILSKQRREFFPGLVLGFSILQSVEINAYWTLKRGLEEIKEGLLLLFWSVCIDVTSCKTTAVRIVSGFIKTKCFLFKMTHIGWIPVYHCNGIIFCLFEINRTEIYICR